MIQNQPVSRDGPAIESLLAARERFLSFIRNRISDSELAEDILQDSLLKAIRAAPNLRDEEKLIPWFYRVLHNATIDAYRMKASVPVHTDLAAAEAMPDDPEVQAVLCECFRALIPGLKREYAEVIEALDLVRVPADEEARRLGVTPNNLKVRHHRARAALRRELEATCRVCAEHHCLDCTCTNDRPQSGAQL